MHPPRTISPMAKKTALNNLDRIDTHLQAIESELNGIALRLEVEATDAKTKTSPVASPLSRKNSSTLLAANRAPGSSRVQLLSEILAPAQKPASSLRDNKPTMKGVLAMRHTLLLTGALCAMTTGLLLATAQATPLSGLAESPAANQTLIEKAGWAGHCWRWRHICAHRWGWGTWRFNRCIVRHGC